MAPDRPSLEERLRAAFAEQVGEHPLRADLVASAAAALPDRSGAPASGWLRMALPSVAVVAAIAVVAAFAVLTGLNPPPFSATVAPSASGSASSTSSSVPGQVPSTFNGQPVYRGAAIGDHVAADGSDTPFYVGGWLIDIQVDCVAPPTARPTSELAPWCPSGWFLTESRSVDSRAMPDLGHGTVHLILRGDVPGSGWQMADPVILQVHAHDPAAATCAAPIRADCDRSVVVDAIVWSAGESSDWPTGVIPWIDASPTPSPAPSAGPTLDPAALRTCAASDLVLVGGGWEGMTGGQLSGGAYVLNVSQDSCRVAGLPQVDLLDANGKVIASGTQSQGDSPSQPVALSPAGVAIVGVAWSNWCGPDAALPLQMRMMLPDGGGSLTGNVRLLGQSQAGGVATTFPGCLDASHGSTMGAYSAFTASTPPARTATSPCAHDQLVAFTGSVGPAAGTEWTTLFILNLPGFGCVVPASPTLELRDADGALIVTATAFPPADATLSLPAATAASATVGLADWCSAKPKGPLSLDLVLGSSRIPVRSLQALVDPGCNSPGEHPPSLLYGMALALPNQPPPPEVNPADSLPMTVNLTLPATVVPGQTLRYTVTLTDHEAYGKTDNLAGLCPNYTQRLTLANGRVVQVGHALNCAPAGTLGAGDAVTFGMELAVPADAVPGSATLVWRLGDLGPSGKGQLEIPGPGA
jgi:hypothetical protein